MATNGSGRFLRTPPAFLPSSLFLLFLPQPPPELLMFSSPALRIYVEMKTNR